MNIFYYSVHHILEDDEIRLLKSLGHNVFCLGTNGRDGACQNFRPPICFSDTEKDFYDEFSELGGHFVFGDIDSIVLPTSFISKFDIFIIMHDVRFIERFWDAIRLKDVIWRTIGQDVEVYEERLKLYREDGLLIVRYSPVETEYAGCIGQDAIIRFYKNTELYGEWTGIEPQIITFSNMYEQRYPEDFRDYLRMVDGHPFLLGGASNENSPNAIGLVDIAEQISLFQKSRVYLYSSGMHIPYTLNFIEAWMTGIPIVAYAPLDRKGTYYEVDRLIESGVNGFVCRDVESARAQIELLLQDKSLARKVGDAGRISAIEHFGQDNIRSQWQNLLDTIATNSAARVQSISRETTVKNMSIEVFNALSLLMPFAIDIDKNRHGNARDGGYVLADVPSQADVISFGVGPDVTFEFEMAERGRRIFLHDHTVDATPQHHHRFHFAKKGICGVGGETAELATLDHHLAQIEGSNGAFILKMDVEGFEWDVFSTIDIEVLERFEQIAIEVHWLENLGDTGFRHKVITSLSKINKLFTLFHVHANNCAELHFVEGFAVASVLELSFIKSSLVRRSPSTEIYPSSLDQGNHPLRHDHALLFFPFLPSTAPQRDIRAVVNRIDMAKKLSAPD